MEETIVLYALPVHLKTISLLANFISRNHPSISVVVLSTAAAAATAPSVTYHRLPTPDIPPGMAPNPIELLIVIPGLNNPNLRDALQKISSKSKIKAIIMDIFCNPGFEVSTSLNIPTYFYLTNGAFTLSVLLHFATIDAALPPNTNIGDLNAFIEVPGCPPIHSSDFPKTMHFRQTETYKLVLGSSINMRKSCGIIVNSFDALEFRAKEAISNGLCFPNASNPPPVYFLGPLIDENNTQNDQVKHECLLWLDSQPSKSVIFLCFGRMGLFSAQQLKEIAIGLENCGHRFLWAVRSPAENEAADLDELLPEGFAERTRERGFIVKSWAPQTEVLSHDSVAGFVTHCGWSSVQEALSFGVPMIGWPLYAEQRMNRVFMVEEMKVALPLEQAENGFVTATELEKRVRELMDLDTVRAIRCRVMEMKISTEASLRKNGSSRVALEKLIDSIMNRD